jgi:hypothetical protein
VGHLLLVRDSDQPARVGRRYRKDPLAQRYQQIGRLLFDELLRD